MTNSARLLLALDDYPWAALTRITVGLAILPLWRLLLGWSPEWTLYPFFLVVLVAMRVVPLVCRKLLRPAPDLSAAWAGRRRLAKKFDSYQWQKLLWVGVGLAIDLSRASVRPPAALIITAISLTGGLAGMVLWRQRARQAARSNSDAPQAPALVEPALDVHSHSPR